MREDIGRKIYFAKADYRGKEQVFGIKAEDRSKHLYVIGKTGMGKTVLLQNMAVQDIQNGNGIAFIDPHGEVTASLLDYVPEERVKDVIHFAPFDADFPISFNVMEDVGYDKRHLVVSGLVSTFKKIWPDVWSPRMEYILSNTLFALLEYPNSTLLDVNRMLVNKEFRKDVVSHITDPVIKSFWTEEFANYTDRYTQEATPAIQNKIGQFVSNPLIRNIVGQPKSSFDFREAMDSKKILIINISKGRIGDTNAKLIGSMLIIKIYLAAMSRADTTATELAKLPPFYFFVDEFQSFANETFADILSESRKYKLSLIIAHQYIGQMPDEVREAVFGNVGTMIVFRVGADDAEVLEKEFSPTFMAEDLVSLGYYQIYLKLMIDGLASKPFSAVTLPPIEKSQKSFKDEVVAYSRETYARPRAEIEKMILERHVTAPVPQKPPKETKTYGDARQPVFSKSPPHSAFREERRSGMERRGEARPPYFSESPARKPFQKAVTSAPKTLDASSRSGRRFVEGGGRIEQRRDGGNSFYYGERGAKREQASASSERRRNIGSISHGLPRERTSETSSDNTSGLIPRNLYKNRERAENVPSRESRPLPRSRTTDFQVEKQSVSGRESNEPLRHSRKEPISLSALRPPQKKSETPSYNADELRKTLTEAIKDVTQESGIKEQVPKGDEKITEAKIQNTNTQNNPPEIPEDELKKILDINSPS